jgi:hypothetical protein
MDHSVPSPHWVCLDCGARQEAKGPCARCGKDDTSDLRDEKIRELMRDVEERLERRREGRLRFAGVLVGISAVVALAQVPGYWEYRSRFLALPLLFDQLLLMAFFGLGASAGLGRIFAKKRFPYLATDLSVRS